jgi:hypothetical protein
MSDVTRILNGAQQGDPTAAEQLMPAEPSLISAYDGMKQREDGIPFASKPCIKENLRYLVQLYGATDQSEKAAEWNKKLAEFDQALAASKTSVSKP